MLTDLKTGINSVSKSENIFSPLLSSRANRDVELLRRKENALCNLHVILTLQAGYSASALRSTHERFVQCLGALENLGTLKNSGVTLCAHGYSQIWEPASRLGGIAALLQYKKSLINLFGLYRNTDSGIYHH